MHPTKPMWLRINSHYLDRCMFERCNQNLHRDGSSFKWHQPCNKQPETAVTNSVDIQNALCKASLGSVHTPSIAFRHLPPRKDVVNQCLEFGPHRVSVFRCFQPELPVTARPNRSRQKQNIDPGKLHRFTLNAGIAHLTDHHSWNGEAFQVLWCTFYDIRFLVRITVNIFIFDFKL